MFPNDATSNTLEFLSGTNSYTFFSSGKHTILSFSFIANDNTGSITLKCNSNVLYKRITSSVANQAFIPMQNYCNGSVSFDTTGTDRGWVLITSVPRDISISTQQTATISADFASQSAVMLGIGSYFNLTFVFMLFVIFFMFFQIGKEIYRR